MTITVTPDADFQPPRMQVDVDAGSGNTMQTVAVFRNDTSGKQLVRTQPSIGFQTRTVFDYECPYGQPVTYSWEATYSYGASTVTFDEQWADVADWTAVDAIATVSGGVVTVEKDGFGVGWIYQTGLNIAWDEIVIESLQTGRSVEGDNGLIRLVTTTGNIVLNEEDGIIRVGNVDPDIGSVATDVPADEPFRLIRTGTSVIIAGESASYTWQFTAGNITEILIQEAAGIDTLVGGITASTVQFTDTLAEESTPATLDSEFGWLIAPQAPALSFPVAEADPNMAGIASHGDVGEASNTTVHHILGTATPVTVSSGPRSAETTTLTVETVTHDEWTQLRALLRPDLPVLFRFPPMWDPFLPDGYYQVGDYRGTRIVAHAGATVRQVPLQLQKVRAPDVNVENPGWSYAQVATTWATYSDLLTNYATYADLLVDERL